MTIKASGRSALILAAGLLVCLAGQSPSTAAGANSAPAASKSETATSGNSVRQSSRYWKRYAHRKSARVSSKSSESSEAKKAVESNAVASSAIPASVANANAQMASADSSGDSASAMTARANTILLATADNPTEAQAAPDDAVVASDQLNDVDRALQETPSKRTVALAVTRPTPSTAPTLASGSEPSAWDQTSLIGKIFIAFGALLTMASAARMFMA